MMPLFKCSNCGCVENTALGAYWFRVSAENKLPLCSECIYGKWHGEFPKQKPKEAGFVLLKDGFYGPEDGSFGAVKESSNLM